MPSVAWALVPLLTLGWGVGCSFGYAAFRLRRGSLALASAGYVTLGVLSYQLVDSSVSTSDWRGNVGAALALVLMAGGTVHACTLRTQISTSGVDVRPSSAAGVGQRQAIAVARARIAQRLKARRNRRLRSDSRS